MSRALDLVAALLLGAGLAGAVGREHRRELRLVLQEASGAALVGGGTLGVWHTALTTVGGIARSAGTLLGVGGGGSLGDQRHDTIGARRLGTRLVVTTALLGGALLGIAIAGVVGASHRHSVLGAGTRVGSSTRLVTLTALG